MNQFKILIAMKNLIFLILLFIAKQGITQCRSPVTSFSYLQGSNGVVSFNSTSTNTNSGTVYQWGFGDGNVGSTSAPTYTYMSNNVFNVCLVAYNTNTNCSSTSCQIINVSSLSATCIPTPNFTYTLGNNGVVNVTSTSTNTNSATQYGYTAFGNNANTSNAVLTFTANGNYNVCLNVNNGNSFCNSTICQTIAVTSVSCNLLANYSSSQGSNGLYNFFNLSSGTNSTTTYFWNFGDGSTSTAINPTKTYSANGTFNACLTVSNSGTVCSNTFC